MTNPATQTRSIGPSPTVWKAISTSPLLAYLVSGTGEVCAPGPALDKGAAASPPRPQPNPGLVPYITSNVSKTMTWAPPRRTGQVSANFAAWSSESAWITE